MVLYMWEETGVPGGNPRVRAGDHHTLSHTTKEIRSRVALVRSESATRTPFTGLGAADLPEKIEDKQQYGAQKRWWVGGF